MMSGSRGKPSLLRPPRNVQQITEAAQEYEYDAAIPLRYWLRSAQAMLKEAEIYVREGDEERTYLLLFRHAHLILSQLPAHPQARDKANKLLLQEAEKEVRRNFKVLDALRPRINERYERYAKLVKEREARKSGQIQSRTVGEHSGQRPAPDQRAEPLKAYENQDFAVRLAQKEISRRAAHRQAALTSATDGDDLSQRLQEIRARVDGRRQPDTSGTEPRPRPAASDSFTYHYPHVPSQHGQPVLGPVPPQVPAWNVQKDIPASAPAVPPKPGSFVPTQPPRPDKAAEQIASRSPTPEPVHTFAPAAYLENGTPLRTIFLPPTLRTTFLRIAHKNTLRNLETCGFLGGTLIANAFFISRLIIPSQTATSDTCEMTNESQLFDYVDSEDLMILGWIHTHPTQTCFMSSRDLHTHAGYQMMLAESIAIVCAPSKGDITHGGDWGVYRLTDPPGKKTILNCHQPGIFHPHDVDNIYTDALRPGHVVEAKGMEFEVVDLRET
ncbi:AMSH-like protease sst2 [Exophiala dermatitidis]